MTGRTNAVALNNDSEFLTEDIWVNPNPMASMRNNLEIPLTKRYKGFLVPVEIYIGSPSSEEKCLVNFVPNNATVTLIGADISILESGTRCRRRMITTDSKITIVYGNSETDSIPMRIKGIL